MEAETRGRDRITAIPSTSSTAKQPSDSYRPIVRNSPNDSYRLGLLQRAGDGYRCPFRIFPVDGYRIVTDMFGDVFAANERNAVIELIREQHLLVSALERKPCSAALDLCTGCGIFALVAARYCDQVWAVDLNPRAVNVARFNALLNDVDNVIVLEGDLYAPIAARTFDLILANPPYNPACGVGAGTLSIHGGYGGEEILSRVLQGLSGHLRDGGTAHIITRLFFDGRSYGERLAAVLDTDAFNVFLLHRPRHNIFTLSNLVTTAWSVGPAGLASLAEHYKSLGIDQEAWGFINVMKVNAGGRFSALDCDLAPELPLGAMIRQHLDQTAV